MLALFALQFAVLLTFGANRYIGCYRDTGIRALPHGPHQYGYNVDTCQSACSDYKYFALQDNGWCCCENDLEDATRYGNAIGCPANRMGAAWLNDLFENLNYDGDNSECKPATSHISAYLSGDPHFRTFNGVHEHFQGNVDRRGPGGPHGRPRDVQYYLMTLCSGVDRSEQPFDLIGSFTRYGGGPMSLENHLILVLYDTDETYYAFISGGYAGNADIPPLRAVYKKSDGASTYLEENNGIAPFTSLVTNGNTLIGRFTVIMSGNDQAFHVTLRDNDDGCELKFYNRLEGNGGVYRWHWLEVQVPPCYLCSNCGLLGDFQTNYGSPTLLGCNGDRISYFAPWGPLIDNYSPIGWTYEQEYHDSFCGQEYEVDDDVPQGFVCSADLEPGVIDACSEARDELDVCCRNLGGGICSMLKEDCEADVCYMVAENMGTMQELVQSEFTEIAEDYCRRNEAFGPVPKLLYDFQDDLNEVMTGGDAKYRLQEVGHAKIENGVLICDGDGDFVYSEQNFDFAVEDHTLEVMVELDSLTNIGGGAIAIDSNYDANNGGYAHNKFDSIVYNEINDQKWFLGSDYFRRTQKGTAVTVETQKGQYIHLVAVYDVTRGIATLYRNGEVEQNYAPGDFMTANEGVRMMFCQRHLHAGARDFQGKIRFGAYYDRALAADEVEQLFDTKMVEVNGVQYEVIGDELRPDQKLTSGQALRSLNGEYVAVMQEGGDFVVYATTTECDCFTNTKCSETDWAVEKNGHYWAWASPCSGYCSDLPHPLPYGWRRATNQEWAGGYPSLADFGNGALCAAEIFDPVHKHCDPTDFERGYVIHYDNNHNYETLVIHDMICERPRQKFNTGTSGANNYLILEGNSGNLVVRDESGVKWSSNDGANGQQVLFLIMQDDGNLVAYRKSSGQPSRVTPYWDLYGHSIGAPAGQADVINKDYDEYDYNYNYEKPYYYNYGGDSPTTVTTVTTTTSMMTYLLYLVVALLVTNIICFTVYCFRKNGNKTKRRYKVVSVDSTDIESDAEEVALK